MIPAYSVLIIDDSQDDIDLYMRLLRTDPAITSIKTAETGVEGIAVYEAEPTDCILLDYHLPGHDGFEVLRRIKARDRHAAVIILTGQSSDEMQAASIRNGASDCIIKEKISVAGLRRAIRNAIVKSDLTVKLEAQRDAQEKFLQKLVHDLRAPLRHASRFAEFLREDNAAGRYEEAAPYPGKIQGAVSRANFLIDALASYLRIDREVELETLPLASVVESAVANLKELIEERHATVSWDELPNVLGMRTQLEQLFQQLITNAVCYNTSGKPEIRIAAERPEGQRWRISVRDNGVGVPPDLLKEIFEPLRRLFSQDKIEGAGMGLAICQRIAEAHGGDIWCTSEVGKGSVFTVTLAAGEGITI